MTAENASIVLWHPTGWMLFAVRELAASRLTETRPRAPKSAGGCPTRR